MSTPLHDGLMELRDRWLAFLALGIALVLFGAICLASVVFATLASVILLGWLLIVSGAFELISAFSVRNWRGFLLFLLTGILDAICGFLLVMHPAGGAEALTLVLSLFLLVGGAFRFLSAVIYQFPNWGWAAVSGVVAFLLGHALWTELPYSGLWFIGACVGVEFIFRGCAWIMFAIAARRLPGSAGQLA